MKSNAFSGLGKMTFKDETQYFGSFNNNCMQSAKAIIKYGNGDTYKGGVQHNLKQGDDCLYVYNNTDTYEGSFRGDKKDGRGKISYTGA